MPHTLPKIVTPIGSLQMSPWAVALRHCVFSFLVAIETCPKKVEDECKANLQVKVMGNLSTNKNSNKIIEVRISI